jgi:hypothetical protein
MARLPKGAEASISMAFVVIFADKIRRPLRLFLWLFMLIIRLSKVRLALDGAQRLFAA